MQCTKKGRLFIIKLGMMVKKGGSMKSSKGRESNQQLFSIVCVYVLLCLSFVVLFFNNKYPDFGNSRRVHQSIKSTRSIIKKNGCSSL